ncbi:uncharacterized protein LOC110114355 [Dendrobium catenatum]|uniref:Chromo domain-containing protein n=1 Tax=Dendrobium catenatum TaxID=906689 RepID=A0A2I0VA37_9ASPA|nr:uncharacterized protein LOC110114355 [Dendrobium catenatum]PKU60269.1 hypothetical protein MA16_Dca028832 [Dendrobium catenatum]
MKGISRFGQSGKLSPRFIGPFEIIERVGQVAYKLALPSDMSEIHNVFHVSMLRKWVTDENQRVLKKDIELQKDLTYVEESEMILDRDVRKLRTRMIPFVQVKWKHRSIKHATWEREAELKQRFPHLFEKV